MVRHAPAIPIAKLDQDFEKPKTSDSSPRTGGSNHAVTRTIITCRQAHNESLDFTDAMNHAKMRRNPLPVFH